MKKIDLAHKLVTLVNNEDLDTCFLKVKGKKDSFMRVYWVKRGEIEPRGSI